MHGCGCETCGGACAWEPPDNAEDNMSKLDGPDGINEEWWDKEMAKPLDPQKLMNGAMEDFVTELAKSQRAKTEAQDAQDPRELFWVNAHNTLVAIDYMLQEQKLLGIFNETTEALLTAAKWALDAEFSRGNRVVEEEADVAF